MSPGRRLKVAVNGVAMAPGGGLTVLVNQARELAADADRFDITYFVSPRAVRALEPVAGPHRIRVPFDEDPPYARRLRWEQITLPRILRDEGFDVLYGSGNFAVLRSPVPQVVLHHNPHHHATRRDVGAGRLLARMRVERVLARAGARRAEGFVCLTRAAADALRGAGFPEPTAIIPSGVPRDWPEPDDKLPLECEQCRFAGGFALAVHNWGRAKRLPWLVRTWIDDPVLSKRHLVLVGRPIPGGDQDVLRPMLQSPEVASIVHHVEGAPREAVAALYRAADVYISASVLEAFPLTPLEALDFGTPPALSRTPQHTEVAGNAATYFGIEDAGELCAAVAEAIERRDALLEAGRRRLEELTWRRHVDLLAGELERVSVLR